MKKRFRQLSQILTGRRPLRDAGAAVVSQVRAGPPRVILFIGHHKVGSTSLQDFLARNAAALAQQGILYPFTDFEGLAHVAADASGRLAQPGTLPINVREPHNALAFRMMASQKAGKIPGYHKRLPALPQMLNAIRQQIRFSQPHTVILAAEVFANFNAVSPALIRQLVNQFPQSEFTLVATLRRIDAYLASWHGQRLKFGHKLEPLRADGLDGYFNGIHFDYRLMLEGWLKALPQAQLILRDYEEVRVGGGSVADFIAQTGLELPEGLAPERRENDSIHRAFYEVVRRGNHELDPPQAAALRRALRQDLPGRLSLPDSRSIELFGAENRQRMLERFRLIDAWLGDVAGRPDGGFFADLDRVAEIAEFPEIEAMQTALEQLRRQVWPDEALRQFLERTHAATRLVQ
jgi:hypothetical protein